jgi:hypothetical protein
MKQSIKISVMALVAMFAFNTVADAQFGSLLKKAKQAAQKVTGSDDVSKNKKEIPEQIGKLKAQIPQKGNTPNALFSWDGVGIASWDGAKNELTVLIDKNGFKPGTVLKVDQGNGKITDASGKDMGSISAIAVVSPTMGTLNLDPVEGNYTLSVNPKVESMTALRSYNVIIANGNQKMFSTNYRLGLDTGQKTGKGYTMFVNTDKAVSYTFAKHKCLVSDQLVGASLPIYVASLMMTPEEYNRENVKNLLGFDPDQQYTTKQLNDMIRWKDDATEAQIKKIEEGKTYGDDRVRGAKIAAIGLLGEWNRTTWTENSGKWNEHKYYEDVIKYWVVYELENGKNKVAFYTLDKNRNDKGLTERGKCTGFHEISDWVRK